MDVRFHRLAAREYEEARTWYERRGTGLGDEFAEETDRAIARIANDPYRRPVCFGRFRRVRLGRFPYSLYYYVVDPSRILVLAVAHARRRPGYWRRRLSY
jgi:plasmid stabilization system protein ParE